MYSQLDKYNQKKMDQNRIFTSCSTCGSLLNRHWHNKFMGCRPIRSHLGGDNSYFYVSWASDIFAKKSLFHKGTATNIDHLFPEKLQQMLGVPQLCQIIHIFCSKTLFFRMLDLTYVGRQNQVVCEIQSQNWKKTKDMTQQSEEAQLSAKLMLKYC